MVLPEHRWPETRRIWCEAQEWGLHHAWTFDHFSWRSLQGEPWYDSLTTLTAVAAVTDRIRLGALVASPNIRHPVPTAKQVMTLDEISQGRFVLGIGAGAADGADARVMGATDGIRRGDRFEEFVSLTDLLLSHPRTSFEGTYYQAVEADMVPGCVQRPRVPFAIAASGPRGLRLAARFAETWVTIGDAARPGEGSEADGLRLLARQLAQLTDACASVRRDPASIGRLVNVSRIVPDPYASVERFVDLVGRCHELGFTDVVVNHPRPSGVFHGDPATFEHAVRQALTVFA
ncbi:LLM class flavin-dependent oxidoreductase [Micromonospora rifamycinica]|uniref:LLM class flavin-dependent oxidoreductase n=1 Tax=Micromonospora rifamycinica TaxID=291594 RepID=UPI002E2B8B80|nr:LLM class flavin-dependent oxidoreductase [Micromonospora rifamycinica]